MTLETKDRVASAGLLLIRVFIGLGLAAHGWGKFFGEQGISGFAGFLEKLGVPSPQVAAYLSASTELVGGLLIAIGLLTRLVAVPLAFNMFVAVVTVHRSSYFLSNDPPGMEYALNLGVIFLALVFTGAGRFSVDYALFRRKPAVVTPTVA